MARAVELEASDASGASTLRQRPRTTRARTACCPNPPILELRSSDRISDTRPGERSIWRATACTPWGSPGCTSNARATSRPVPLNTLTTLREGTTDPEDTSALTKRPGVLTQRCPLRSNQARPARLSSSLAAIEIRSATMIVAAPPSSSCRWARSRASLSRTALSSVTAKGATGDLDTLPSQADWGDPACSRASSQPWGVRCSWCHEYRLRDFSQGHRSASSHDGARYLGRIFCVSTGGPWQNPGGLHQPRAATDAASLRSATGLDLLSWK